MHSKLLLIFMKNPVAGEVKTRLARDVGSLNALQIYKQLLRYTREVASAADADRQVWYSSKIDRRDAWSEDQFQKKLQKGEDLGERMSEAFCQGFEQEYQKIVIIGSDCAELTAGHLERAYQALENHDAVIGPSEDGGYYLLGLTSFEPRLFRGVDWSTSNVFQQTLDKFEAFKMSYHALETLNDIDTVDDLKRSSLGIQ